MPVLDAKLNYLANPLHQDIQILGLRMAARKCRNSRHLEIFFVAFDHNRIFAR